MKALSANHILSKLSYLKTFLLPLLLLLSIGLAACGGNQATASSTVPNASKRLTTNISPCSLLTQQQVEQVLKTSLQVTPPQKDSHGGYLSENPCDYKDMHTGGSVDVFLLVLPDAETARERFNPVATQTGSDFHTITDLGEQALLVAQPVPQLYVQKDNAILIVGVVNNAPLATLESQEQQLAKLAVQAM